MTRIMCGVVGLCLFVAGVGLARADGPSQSLADVARQEQARRKAVKRPGKVYTNADVPTVAAATADTATELSTTPKDPGASGDGVPEGDDETARARAAGQGASKSGSQAGAASGASSGAGGAQGGAKDGAQGGVKPKVAAGDEAQWRGRVGQAREAVSRAQLQLEAMRTRVLHLQSARAIGNAEASTQDTLQRQQRDALQEFDKLRADVERYQKALADVEAEARQSGVPAGWLR